MELEVFAKECFHLSQKTIISSIKTGTKFEQVVYTGHAGGNGITKRLHENVNYARILHNHDIKLVTNIIHRNCENSIVVTTTDWSKVYTIDAKYTIFDDYIHFYILTCKIDENEQVTDNMYRKPIAKKTSVELMTTTCKMTEPGTLVAF